MSKPFYSKLSLISFVWLALGINIKECFSASHLGDYGTIIYEETHGFPTTVQIGFVSDLVVNDEESAKLNEMYFTYELSGTGAPFYSDTRLIINNSGPGNGDIQFDLTKSNEEPEVGVYTIVLAIDLMFKNPAGDIKMIEKTYQLTVYLQGAEASMQVDTTGQVASQIETTDNSETNVETADSVLPVDLALTTEGNVGFGDDIVLQIDEVGLDSNNYKIWLDTSQVVEVYSDVELTNKVYDWPPNLVDAIDNENEAGMTLTVTLRTVPVDLYDLGKVYVKLYVKFRDLAGDFTRIRHLGVSGTGIPSNNNTSNIFSEDQAEEDLSANFITAVTFDSYKYISRANAKNNKDDESSIIIIALIVGFVAGVGLVSIALAFWYMNREPEQDTNRKPEQDRNNMTFSQRSQSLVVNTFKDRRAQDMNSKKDSEQRRSLMLDDVFDGIDISSSSFDDEDDDNDLDAVDAVFGPMMGVSTRTV